MKQDFLVEIGTEELPPKSLKTLMSAFTLGIEAGLNKAKLQHAAIRGYATPRRLGTRFRSPNASALFCVFAHWQERLLKPISPHGWHWAFPWPPLIWPTK